MAREQGDELGDVAVYIGDVDGERVERPAYTTADVVNLEARGWVRKESGRNPEPVHTPRTPDPVTARRPAPAAAENA